MTRRDKGAGSIYREGDRWVGQLDVGRTMDGKRRRRKVSGRTKSEVRAKLRTARAEAELGLTSTDNALTVADYLTRWLTDIPRDAITEKTRQTYGEALRNHIVPTIGHIRLRDLSPAHVRRMLGTLEARGLAANTRRNARAVLRRGLRIAEQDGLVLRNAAAIADAPPTTPPKTDDVLSKDELETVLTKTRDDRLHALAVVALLLGLRSGEARALRWSDIDFEQQLLSVTGTLSQRAGGGVVRTRPKTKKSKRTIPLPQIVTDALIRHRSLQALEAERRRTWRNAEDYVFTTTHGTPIDRFAALKWWKLLCIEAGIEPRRFHAARHSAATYLLDRGVPLEVVSAILGHSSLSITADIYAQVTEDAMRRAFSVYE